MSLNRVVIMGRLTAAPELKFTQNGLPVTTFSVAVDRAYKAGERPETDFFQVVAWRKTAEFAAKHFERGDMIAVDGRLQSRSYTDGHQDVSTRVRSNTQRLSMSVYPAKTLTLSLAAEDNYNNLSATNRHAWFGDATAKLKLKRIDLELQMNNLFDQRQYTRVSYRGLDIYTQTSRLRPRNAIFTVRFKLL